MLGLTAAGQRGQALIAVMVVMLILFALAGAVAIGASTLLTRRGESGITNNDFQVRSAVNDSVAQIAGVPKRCGAPPPLPSPSPAPAPTPNPTPLNLVLPGSVSTQALCAREDTVVPTLHRFPVTSNCVTVHLYQPDGRLAVLFDMRSTAGGWAYLDTSSGSAGCGGPMPSPTPSGLPCRQSFGPGSPVQVALTCDFAKGDTAYLHINVTGIGPKQVFAATEDPQGQASAVGFLYLIASGTGVPSPNDLEESVLYISKDGSTTHLLYEAPLP